MGARPAVDGPSYCYPRRPVTEDDESSRSYAPALAERALRRAARLQVEAAEQAERRSAPSISEPDGYRREELVAAAGEVGIDEEFISVALAELDEPGGTVSLALADPAEERAARRWLGTSQRNIVVTRVIDGTPKDVWGELVAAFEAETCGLKLRNITGDHPARGGVAQFTMMSLSRMVSERKGFYSQLCYRMEQLELTSLTVKLRDLGARTQVTVYADLREGVRINLRWARRSGGGIGVIAGGGAAAAGATVGMAVAAATGLLGLLVGGALAVAVWRATYRHALRAIETELQTALDDVGAALLPR